MAKLTLVGLPIGNAQDISKRGFELLQKQKSFLVEDTRNFKSLLGHYGLPLSDYRLESFHDHNKEFISKIIQRLNRGEDIYICSDAGSPVLSDPAFPLVREAIDNQHEIDSIPGVSSPIVALELSGLPPHPFTFWGFLPRKDQAKLSWFNELSYGQTHISFESPVRMKNTIDLFFYSKKEGEEVNVVVVRELTKLYQESVRFNLSEWKSLCDEMTFRGEMILLLYKEGSSDQKLSHDHDKLLDSANLYLNKQTPRNLSKLLATILGGKPNEYYQRLTNSRE